MDKFNNAEKTGNVLFRRRRLLLCLLLFGRVKHKKEDKIGGKTITKTKSMFGH